MTEQNADNIASTPDEMEQNIDSMVSPLNDEELESIAGGVHPAVSAAGAAGAEQPGQVGGSGSDHLSKGKKIGFGVAGGTVALAVGAGATWKIFKRLRP
jgi:lactobin A/cerein 7B family class IIb bacteriocin